MRKLSVFEQTSVERSTSRRARSTRPGVHALLDRLEAQLAGVALPDFFARFAEVRGEYPEWGES